MERSDPGMPVTLASAETYVWRAWALYMLVAAALFLFAGCKLRVPLNFVAAPVYMVAMQPNLRLWWWPLAGAVVFMGLPLVYRRFVGSPPTSRRMLDDNVFKVDPSQRRGSMIERWRARRLRRAIGAQQNGRAVAMALLSIESHGCASWLLTISLAAVVAYLQPLSAAWWGSSSHTFIGLFAAFIALPGPVGLAQIWLLPVGMSRSSMGETLVAVWVRRARTRIVVGTLMGMLILLIMHVIDPAWPVAQTQWLGARTVTEKLLVAPLSLAFALNGIAYTAFALIALWPPMFTRSSPQALPALSILVTPVLVMAGTFVANALAANSLITLRPSTVFLICFGVIFPAIAWALLRTRRGAWQRADLATISARFASWGRRIEALTAFDRDVQRRL